MIGILGVDSAFKILIRPFKSKCRHDNSDLGLIRIPKSRMSSNIGNRLRFPCSGKKADHKGSSDKVKLEITIPVLTNARHVQLGKMVRFSPGSKDGVVVPQGK